MIFEPLPLKGSFEIQINALKDNRGWFARTYSKEEFAEIGHKAEWVQMNHSFTNLKGSLRGLHFQHPPFTEIKLVRCIAGAVLDVIVDLRKGSDTFLQWHSLVLSADKQNMLYIPHGFAHGFQTLEDNCEMIYHHSAVYSPAYEDGIRYDDPMLKILWNEAPTDVSARDLQHNYLSKEFKGI